MQLASPPPLPAPIHVLLFSVPGLRGHMSHEVLGQELWAPLNSRTSCAGVWGETRWDSGVWEEAGIYLLREASLPLLGPGHVDLAKLQEGAGWPLGNLGLTGSQFSSRTVHPQLSWLRAQTAPPVLPGVMGMGPGTGEDL